MTPTATGLMEIHDLREQLEKLTAQIQKGPRQIAIRQKSFDDKSAELEVRRARLKQMKVAADGKSLQLKSSESKIFDLQGKLNSVATNREFDALKTQIAADKMATSVLEDEIFETLEGVDAVQAEVKQFEQEIAAAEAELRVYINEVKQLEPDLKRQIDELQERIASCEAILPADILPMYRRLVSAYGSRALAPVTAKACGECYVGLTSQTLLELKAGNFKFCTCGRLMYFVGNHGS